MGAEKQMQIAILGWGSLLWEDRPDFDKQHEPTWHLDGPELNIEFSRKSRSRQGALTLVVDDKNGSPTTVAWSLSTRERVEDAICDLRCREGTTDRNIGRICLTADSQVNPSASPVIAAWAKGKNLDAVVWTALQSNFENFSVGAAIDHIKKLDPCGKAKAAEYVLRAPEFVQTPLRRALQQKSWFSVS